MSFGGSVLAMIQSLRANARPKHRVYDALEKAEERRFGVNKKLWSKSVSPEELARIKAKFKKKITTEQHRSTIITIFSVIILIPLILFTGFEFFFNAGQKQEQARQTVLAEEKIDLEQINYLLNSGYEWLNKKHYKNARFQFNRVLELQPENKTAKYGMAASYVYQCEIDSSGCDEAEKLLNAYIEDYGEDDSTDLLKEMLAN